MISVSRIAGAVAILLFGADANALPRFAARNGNECIQCHVNPTGGGMRNSYGRNVFEKVWLSYSARPTRQPWVLDTAAESAEEESAAKEDDATVVFTSDINEWLALGADLRVAYIFIRPELGSQPGTDPEDTNSFFLMQADLYHAATLNDHVTLVLDIGVYSGFEAWALLGWNAEPKSWDLMLKIGRFMPAFGIREVEHQLFTRGGIGLGNSDRDTGLELTAYMGPITANLALVNGTFGETAFDNHGAERKTVEKAVVGRLSARTNLGWFRGQLGLSYYFNQNTNQPNPLFAPGIPFALLPEVSAGLNETRVGAFVTANLGRFTYLGDVAFVRDKFRSDAVPTLTGYASYQELSFVPVQGLEMVATFEFADPDVDLLDNRAARAGFVVEFFPWPFTEVRAMVRRKWDDVSPTGGAWDVVLFTHIFM